MKQRAKRPVTKRWWALLCALTLTVMAHGQTALSGTVIDQQGTTWQNAAWTLSFTPTAACPGIPNGSSGVFSGQLSSEGVYNVVVPQLCGTPASFTMIITPFTTTATNGGLARTFGNYVSPLFTVSGSAETQNFTPPPPMFPYQLNTYGYTTTELTANPTLAGSQFYIPFPAPGYFLTWTGSEWINLNVGAGGGLSGMTAGQIPVAATASTVTSSIAYATANTASTIVERDSSGNINGGTVSATELTASDHVTAVRGVFSADVSAQYLRVESSSSHTDYEDVGSQISFPLVENQVYDLFAAADGTSLNSQIAMSGNSQWSVTGADASHVKIIGQEIQNTATSGNVYYAALPNTTSLVGGTYQPIYNMGLTFVPCDPSNPLPAMIAWNHLTGIGNAIHLGGSLLGQYTSSGYYALYVAGAASPYETPLVTNIDPLTVNCAARYDESFAISYPTEYTTTATWTLGATSITVASATGIAAGMPVLDGVVGLPWPTESGNGKATFVASSYTPGSTTVPITQATTTANAGGSQVVFGGALVSLYAQGQAPVTVVDPFVGSFASWQMIPDTAVVESNSTANGVGNVHIANLWIGDLPVSGKYVAQGDGASAADIVTLRGIAGQPWYQETFTSSTPFASNGWLQLAGGTGNYFTTGKLTIEGSFGAAGNMYFDVFIDGEYNQTASQMTLNVSNVGGTYQAITGLRLTNDNVSGVQLEMDCPTCASYPGTFTVRSYGKIQTGSLAASSALTHAELDAGTAGQVFAGAAAVVAPSLTVNSEGTPVFTIPTTGIPVIPGIKSTTGDRYVCVDTSGNLVSSATACSGT